MGTILSCFQFSQSKSAPSAKSPNHHNSASHDTPHAQQTQDIVAQESQDLTRKLGVGGPVPGPAVPNTDTTNHNTKEGAKDKMATDEEYMSFLDKANQDPNEGAAEAKQQSNGGGGELKALDKGAKVPKVLEEGVKDKYYVSDADEPFVPVCLKLKGKGEGLPDEDAFVKLIEHPSPGDAGVEIMDVAEWDSQGQYKDVVDAVREAGKGGDVRVYRVGRGGARVEYWVVTVEGGRLVGVKVLAVES
ncbi:uncharacterized protein LY89DRAFT_44312 [Mollisia scopiformis]|uniref:Uncharacterized protein n=1 Tax=Mollisia scopiformis TaxID=149040 RepID=A0A194XDL6_MOLSC|nr:uncharacterized protein LY89DRAFT_44312 [Mollisia scopiformis]KUJ18268.1 hypothetical protein LY89DRAFT_44312 [Mollisia scopiformis]